MHKMTASVSLACLLVGALSAQASPHVDYKAYAETARPSAVLVTNPGDALSRGFAWQTSQAVTDSKVWLLEGAHTAADAALFLSKGRLTEGESSSVSAPAATCHRVVVRNLVAGRTYSYRLGAGDANDVYGTFEVKPADDTLTALYLSDAQTKDYAKLGVFENTVTRAVATAGGAAALDCVIAGGDIYDENAPYFGGQGERPARTYYKYRMWGIGVDTATYALPGVPWLMASGNHDYTVYADATAVDWQSSVSGCRSFDLGCAHVAVVPYLGGWGDKYVTALDWLASDLAAASNALWKIVALHWGPYVTGDHYLDKAGTGGASKLILKLAPICASRHVDLVLQGHDHVFTKTLPYRWDAAGYTTSLPNDAIVNHSPATVLIGGVRYDDNPNGTYYVSTGAAGHRVGENEDYAELSPNAHCYTNGHYKIATDVMDVDSAWGHAGDDASHDLSASMFGLLRIAGNRLEYDFYVVATNGVAAPVLYDTLRVYKGVPRTAADAFRVTPYVQRPATNAMSVLWLTETNAPATIRWWPAAGGSERQLTTTPAACPELFYTDKDTNDFNTAWSKGKRGRESGPLLSPPWQHRVRLDGLAAGTRYAYVVELAGGAAYTNAFRTAPGRDAPVRFIAYSDSETEPESTGKPDNYWTDPVTGKKANYYVDQTVGYASNVVRMVERDPDFFLISGDLVQYGYEQRDWDEFWRHQAGVYNDPAGSIPILASPGNHDVINSSGGENGRDGGTIGMGKWCRYFEFNPNGVAFPSVTWRGRSYAYDRSEVFHRTDYGRVTVICIDSNNGDDSDPERDSCLKFYAGGNGTTEQPAISPDFNPGSPQFAWLTNQLADAQAKGQFTFVSCHHMPYSVGYHNRTNGVAYSGYVEPYSARALRVLTPYMIKYGVKAWIAGHDEIMEHSRVFGRDVAANGVAGVADDAELNLYDVGNSGDGLRGGGTGTKDNPYLCGEANPYEVFRAEVNAPPVVQDGVLIDGARHYGHLEVEVAKNAQGEWACTLTPVYIFISKDKSGNPCKFERRIYDDVITLDENGRRKTAKAGFAVIML